LVHVILHINEAGLIVKRKEKCLLYLHAQKSSGGRTECL